MFTLRADGRYQGTYYDKNGVRRYIYDKDPERLWHKLNDPKDPERITFRQLAESWQKDHWEEIGYKTAEAYTAPLRRIVDHFGDLEEVTAASVSAFLHWLGTRGYSRRSVQMHRDILNMIFNHAIVEGKAKINPCAAVSMPRNLPSSKRTLPDDDAIASVKNGLNQPFGLFAYLCLYSGLRRAEALALEYADIDRKAGLISVTKAVEFIGNNPHLKTPKTEAGYRSVILLDPLKEAIPENGKGYLFARPDGGLLTKTQYRTRWAAYCKAIGFPITAHQLRHGFATILYEAEIPDKDAQELLGHSNITLTRNVYTHIRKSRREDTASRLNAFLSKNDV